MINRLMHRVRFHFHTGDGVAKHDVEAYHRDLIEAELLLDRVGNAKANGHRPVHPTLTAAALAEGIERPNKMDLIQSFGTPEYVRWIDAGGAFRLRPLSQEELTRALAADRGVTLVAASHLAGQHSKALPERDLRWHEERLSLPANERPLDASEFATLAASLEAAHAGAGRGARQHHENATLAVKAAAMVGAMLDEFVPSPFQSPILRTAYLEAHVEHLRQLAGAARTAREAAVGQAASASTLDGLKQECKAAEWHAELARRAIDGVTPTPTALSVTLETSDGREIWWSVMAVDPDGVKDSAVCEAVVRTRPGADGEDGDGETIRMIVEVHYDDGSTSPPFEGTGDDWRDVEMYGREVLLYRRLLDGEQLADALEALREADSAPTLGACA